MTNSHESTVGILMPKISSWEMFSTRYAGLEEQLAMQGIEAAFAFSQASYDPLLHALTGAKSTENKPVDATNVKIVRDLTMPASQDNPIYVDPSAPTLVHHPDFNSFLKDKRNIYRSLPEIHPQTIIAKKTAVVEAAAAICGETVVIKPVVGQGSRGVFIGKKAEIDQSQLTDQHYMVQEFINTKGGVKELDIKNVHNVRIISIDSNMLGAVGRINSLDGLLLQEQGDQDIYSRVYLPEDLPDTMLQIANKVNGALAHLPGAGRSVTAIDVMRGVNAADEEVDVLCEVNRRPIRISAWDLREPLIDPIGIDWLAKQWDTHEAAMLADINNG